MSQNFLHYFYLRIQKIQTQLLFAKSLETEKTPGTPEKISETNSIQIKTQILLVTMNLTVRIYCDHYEKSL